ncbi:hypothetical protein SAMN05444920_12483 [Nonomuraea solani]|uniref:Uncharacterized protein n=1 Tax=Nonomuraea solani TaxID=1144553 RepID=A0A1H6EWC8_9ACTN|nr:hypothetical protein [Nonomuraea solani]SEH02148.1 hypothetical protein SAMN05444920_12483 [Nonomuraea solani]
MHPLSRLAVLLVAITSLIGLAGVAPAGATVYNSCTISRCADARSARSIWASKGYPTTRTWYSWPDGHFL